MKHKTPEYQTFDRYSFVEPKMPYFRNDFYVSPHDSYEKAFETNVSSSKNLSYKNRDWDFLIWIGLMGLSCLIFYIIKNPKPSDKRKKYEILIKEKRIKKEHLDFDPFIKNKKYAWPDSLLKNNHFEKAFISYSKIKTDSPYQWQPRLKLYYAFSNTCLTKGRYCGNAQKEFRYLLKYLPKGRNKKLRKALFKNRNEVRKKVISIFRKRGETHKILRVKHQNNKK